MKLTLRPVRIPNWVQGIVEGVDASLAPLGSLADGLNLFATPADRQAVRGGSAVVNTLHDASGTPQTNVYADTFTAEGANTALPAHTPTGSPNSFAWVQGTYATCPDFTTSNSVSPTNVAKLPATGPWGADHSLTADILTNLLDPQVSAVDVVSHAMTAVEQVVSAVVTIPSGMTKDAMVGLLLGANADGSGGWVMTMGYFPSAGRQRVAVWSRDGTGVMTLMLQSSFPSGLFTFDVPFTATFTYDGTNLIDFLGNTTPVTITTPGYQGVFGAVSGDGGSAVLTLDNFNADLAATADAELSDVLRIEPFSPVAALAVGWSANLSKHYAYRLTSAMAFFTGSEASSRTDLTASPSTGWDVGPARPFGVELFSKFFLVDGTEAFASRNPPTVSGTQRTPRAPSPRRGNRRSTTP